MFSLCITSLRHLVATYNLQLAPNSACLRLLAPSLRQLRFVCEHSGIESRNAARSVEGTTDAASGKKERQVPEGYDGTFFEGPLPMDKLTKSFQQSGGPGGQNVNKVETKVVLSFHLESADWLPRWIRHRLASVARNRINKSGVLQIGSDQHRSQIKNIDEAKKKLSELIADASHVPWRPSASAIRKQKRLKHLSKRKRYSQLKYHRQTENVNNEK